LTREGRWGHIDLPGSSLNPTGLADASFESAVLSAAEGTGARLLHPEGVAGLPLESLLRLQARGLSLVLSVHDFALFCVRPHLVERPADRFCDYCRELDRCARCLATDWRVPEGFQARRRALAREVLLSADAVVYPSAFLRDQHAELFGPLEAGRQHLVVPAVDPVSLPPPPEPRQPIRHIAYVGAVHPHKGALVFEEVVKALASTADVRFTVLGGGDPAILARLRRLPRVRVRGYYRSGSLPAVLCRESVDLALLLSIWPESYGITLDECRAVGVPVVAFDHGAMGERVRREGAGTQVPAGEGARGVADAIHRLAARRATEGPPTASPASVQAHHPSSARESAAAVLRLYSRSL
jgi:glycosyltransferase involved in cell wall biosynthesis